IPNCLYNLADDPDILAKFCFCCVFSNFSCSPVIVNVYRFVSMNCAVSQRCRAERPCNSNEQLHMRMLDGITPQQQQQQQQQQQAHAQAQPAAAAAAAVMATLAAAPP